ncbi:hypothetical protein F511_37422 [Dorcoceras hygrometricum]|uniref:Uncharacterized protein n=1 Tax=Dorcoceras hygrometricum TaxID=472368 RepID=A0A2Z7C946_9LAMI|nr:hypothetical protein F511_37422 [Dorcoceras hygrometricum]
MPPRRRGRGRGQFQDESGGQNEDQRSFPFRSHGRRVEDEVDDLTTRVESIEIVMARSLAVRGFDLVAISLRRSLVLAALVAVVIGHSFVDTVEASIRRLSALVCRALVISVLSMGILRGEHCDVLSMQMDSDLVIYRTTLIRTFQVVTICRVDKSEVLVVSISPHYSKSH